jgi:hypothetical protein
MNSIPFSRRGGLHTGFLDLEGIVRIEGTDLVVEFRTRHRLARFLTSEPKEIRVPLTELEEVSFKNLLWLGFLEIRARRLSAFNAMLGCDGGQLRLRCRRAHWRAAKELASKLTMSILAEDLKAMVDGASPPSRLLGAAPAQPAGPGRSSAGPTSVR